MYVIVDWHILEDNDPNINIDAAKAFFEMISSEYSSVPNIIYEICNEPNCDTDWNDVYGYSEQIIKIIRNNCIDSLILVGTPELLEALEKGLPVFISECGISEASGDGDVDYRSAVDWFEILGEYGIISHLIRNIAYRVLR